MKVGMLQEGTRAQPMLVVACHTICEKWPEVMVKPGWLKSYCLPSLYPATEQQTASPAETLVSYDPAHTPV